MALMTTSPLADWAFASAMGTSGKEMTAFLAARDGMRRAMLRDHGLAEALESVAKLGLWARTYFIPDLCALLRSRQATDEARIAKDILLELLDGEASALRRSLVSAVRDASGAAQARQVLQAVDQALTHWLVHEDPVNFSTLLDVTDIEVFIAPTMILGLAIAAVQDDALVADRSTSEAIAEAWNRLNARALAGSYGRLPFLMAIDLAIAKQARPDLNAVRDALRAALTPVRGQPDNRREKLLAAPDILARLVKLRFGVAQRGTSPDEALYDLAEELVRLTTYRELCAGLRPNGVSLALWHDALFHLMLEVDPAAAARLLAQVWRPRIQRPAGPVAIRIPFAPIPEDLEPLLRIVAQPPGRAGVAPAITADPAANFGDSGLLLSPWLDEREGSDEREKSDANWAMLHPPERLRWLSGLSVDVRILEQLPFTRELNPFALHLIANLQPLKRYQNYEGPGGKGWEAHDLVKGDWQLGWLARGLNASAIGVLGGEGRAGLGALMDLLEVSCDSAASYTEIRPADVDEERAKRLKKRLATGALRLVEHAMSNSWRGWDEGWLGFAGRVLDVHRPFRTAGRLLQHDIVHGLIAKYLVFTSSDGEIVDTDILDDVAGMRGSRGWKVVSRRLLLAPLDDAGKWVGPGDRLGAPTPGVRLARALMRVVAAWEDERLNPETAQLWRADLRRELGGITEVKEFDGFARLQLIDMIAKGMFNDEQSDLLGALTALVTFGRPLHIRALLRALIESPVAGDGTGRVRMAVYSALTRFLANDPDQKEEEAFRAKTLLLRQLQAACLFASQPEQRDAVVYLLNHVRDQVGAGAEESTISRPVSLPSETRDRQRMLPLDDPWISPGTAQMMAIDGSRAEARFVQEPPPMAGVSNGFARQSGPVTGPYLGVVEDQCPDPQAGRALSVRFMPDKLVRVGDPEAEPPLFGQTIVVDSVNRVAGPVQEASPPGRALRLGRPGERRIAQVQAVTRDGRIALLSVRTPSGPRPDLVRNSLNFAWLVQPDPPPYEIRLQAKGNMVAPSVEPTLLDASDLLIEYSDGACTLALYERPREDAAGLRSIIFEDRPLRRYVISMDFGMTEACRRDLEAELARLEQAGRDPLGLLVSFTLVSSDLGPQLDLACTAGEPDCLAYPELARPFDDRNLWWRDRFEPAFSDEDQVVLAHRTKGSRYRTDIPSRWSFPSILEINTTDRGGVEAFFELIPESWDPWNGTINGNIEPESFLKLPADAQARAAAIRWLDGLKPGAAFSLTPTMTIRDDGRIYCRTEIGLTVLVNAESVSMCLPCKPMEAWPQERSAILSYLNWRRGAAISVPASHVPPAAIANGRARGYLTKAPRELDGAAPCQVAWLRQDGPDTLERELRIETVGRETQRLRAGSRIEIDVVAGTGWISEPVAIANAVWHRAPDLDREAPPEGRYIGSLAAGDGAVEVYELGRGQFALRPSATGQDSPRVALQRFLRMDDDQDYVVATDSAAGLPRATYSSAGRRCALKLRDDEVAAGVTGAELIRGKVRVTGLQLLRYPTPIEGCFLFERSFQLLPERERMASPRPAAVPDQRAIWAPLILGTEIPGRFNPKSMVFQVRGDQRNRFTTGIEISRAHMQRAPLSPDEYFPGDHAKARIIAVDPPSASLIDIKPSSLGDLRTRLLAASQGDGSRRLNPAEIRLVFVGRKSERDDESGEDQAFYMFEWGYGLWLALPSSQLRYQEEGIDTAEFLLFFGDRITAAEVVDSEEGPRLVIESIEPSLARELFLHSTNDKVINLLNVTAAEDGSPVIASIEGFNPRILGPSADLRLPHASVDEETALLLRERLVAKDKQRILARLDTDKFFSSRGETLLFHRARLDMDDRVRGIAPDDRFLVRAGGIVSLPNDVGLQVHHPGLHADDVHPTFLKQSKRSQLVIRRSFSFREQTLSDILALNDRDALAGDYLMVRLTDRLKCSLKDGSPPRNPRILRELIRAEGEALAIYGDQSSRSSASLGKLRLELRPGIVITLPPDEVSGAEGLLPGDVVRLQVVADGGFSAELASWSDLSFVSDGRPAILLPRQTLGQPRAVPPYPDDQARQNARSAFSVGDLPALAATAIDVPARGRSKAADEAFIAFMSQPHPKLGQLRSSGSRSGGRVQFTFGLGEDRFPGRLRFGPNLAQRPRMVDAVRLDRRAEDAPIPTDWYLLSYRDGTAAELEQRTSRAEWRLHDSETITWARASRGQLVPSWVTVPPITPQRGPLFFSRVGEVATLRRPAGELLAFASGTGALLDPLNVARASKSWVSAVVAAAAPGGLLVELWPGRITLIPGGIAKYGGKAGPVSLRAYDWLNFGAGDILRIRAASRPSALAPLEVEMDWSQGARNAFGTMGAVLARDPQGDDPAKGAAIYGAGRQRVTIPSQDVSKLPAVAVIGGDRHLRPLAADRRPLVGHSVLLVEVEEGRLGVHGLPGVIPFPDADWGWADDDLMKPAIAGRRGEPVFDHDRAIQLIRLAGGALPFTVTRVLTHPRAVIHLSREHQQFRLADGKLAIAQIEGEVGDSRHVLLRVGGRHLAVRSDTLVSGVSAKDLPFVLATLASEPGPIWLRADGGRLQSGHRSTDLPAFTVSPMRIVGHEGLFLGILCEGTSDGRLYWLPQAVAAACTLTLAEARRIFESTKLKRMQVALLPNGAISVVDHPRAAVELSKLKLGASIFVDRVEQTPLSRPFWDAAHVDRGWATIVVQSKQTSTIFAAAVPQAYADRDTFPAEVAVRQDSDEGSRILLAVAGERLVASGLPAWLLGYESPPWSSGDTHYLDLPALEGASAYVEGLNGGAVQLNGLEAKREAYVRSGMASLILGAALAAAADDSAENGEHVAATPSRVSLLRNLYARALRSLPLEHLATWGLREASGMSPITVLWYGKLRELFHHGRLMEAREACERWLDIIAMEGVKSDEEALANAFAVMIGVESRPQILVREAGFLPRVISATRPVYLARDPSAEVVNEASARVIAVALDLLDNGYDIPLAAPINF